MHATFARRSVLLGGLAIPVANALSRSLVALLVEDGALAAPDWQGNQPEAYIERLKRRFANALIQEARDEPVETLFAAQGRPVIFIGQRIRLRGSYRTDGQSIAVIGREVEVAPGTTIDTRGLRGDPHHLPGNRAADGPSWGAHGTNGLAGGIGAGGGDVVLLCRRMSGELALDLSGGPGGDGQAGGNGMNGAAGANGRGRPRCENGGGGGAGGNAGAGGGGGVGGAGGIALIQTMVPLEAAQLHALAAGGLGGKAGAHGNAGAGGPGGRGTSDWEHEGGGIRR